MNSHEPYDDLHSVLQRSADYLVRRGAEYREQPVTPVHNAMLHHRRSRRLLVGAGAVATLCGAVLVGSFIGGASGGPADLALAAFATPRVVTASERSALIEACRPLVQAVLDSMPPATGFAAFAATGTNADPESPDFVDARGSVAIAVYGTDNNMIVCSDLAGQIEAMPVTVDVSNTIWSTDSFTESKCALALDAFSIRGVEGLLIHGSIESEQQWTDFKLKYPDKIVIALNTQVVTRGSKTLYNFAAWVPASGRDEGGDEGPGDNYYMFSAVNDKGREIGLVGTAGDPAGTLPETTVPTVWFQE